MTMPAERYDELAREDIEDALSFIRVNLLDREEWVRLGRALWSEFGDAEGWDIWESWSRTADWFSEREARQQWRSINVKGSKVKIGTLLHVAMENGWKFNAKERRQLTAEELAAKQAKRDEQDKLTRELERKRHGEAAKLANEIWAEGYDAAEREEPHPYLVRKGIQAHGLRIGKWPLFKKDTGEVYRWVDDVLLIPRLNKDGKLRSLQGIFARKLDGWESDKAYLRGGDVRGTFHLVGTPKPGQSVLIAEGYATAASLHEATGWCVAVAFDSANLLRVAEALSDTLQGHSFVFAADNDQWSRSGNIENPGVHYATEAGKVINSRVVVPKFTAEQIAHWQAENNDGRDDKGPTDFNDLAAMAGPGEVVRQVIPALPVAANDNTAGELVDEDQQPEVDRFGLPDLGGRGAVLATHGNLAEICRRLRVTLRYNQVTKEQEILIPGKSFSVDNYHIASYAWLENECVLFRMPTEKLRNGLTYLCESNQYNPVCSWVTSRPWDRVPRLQQLFDTITEADVTRQDGTVGPRLLKDGTRLRDALVRRWMLSAIAAAFNPDGVAAQGMLVLQGPQDLGKTRWLMSLTPRQLRLAKEGATLNPTDRDSQKQALSFWLVELGELDATFRKSDIAALKAFITRESDILRLPYAPKDNHFARRTVFFGSVNPKLFLHDPTGNRRFWTIECRAVNADHGLDMQQVWAEVLELYKAGEQWHLNDAEKAALNDSNEEFKAIDPVEERLQTALSWTGDPVEWRWKTATDVLLSIGVEKPTQADCTKASDIIKRLNGGKYKRSNGKNQLLVPPPIRRGMMD